MTINFNWVRKDLLPYNDMFRKARSKSRNPMNSCKWCGNQFADNEMISLAQPTKGKNFVLCKKCADEAIGGEDIQSVEVGNDE